MEQPTQAEALRTIAEWPITDPNNMDAVNMAAVARQALRASQQAERAVPAGWKLVPLEPTPEMISAWPNNRHGSGHEAEIYKSMISAAPVQQAGDAEMRKDAERYRHLRDGDWRECEELESIIRLQLNTLWDAKIDAAIASKQP